MFLQGVPMTLRAETISRCAEEVGKKLMRVLTVQAGRKVFFTTLSHTLQKYFSFDRLCINLYDQQGEMLTYFTAVEGTVVSTLSPVRPAEPSSTVAGHVIATRKPVVITDFDDYFATSSVHPIVEAGLTATMGFPLILDNEIIATLHCSFARKPENIYEITSLFLEISPLIAICLGVVLSLEQAAYDRNHIQARPHYALAGDEQIVCHSKAMREVMRRVAAVSPLNIPILLLGETGTGKSLLAQDIHRRSPRKERPFVRVNCPGLVSTLFESELFGHTKGAFTGASSKRTGRFEMANGGTVFLDEIAELSPEMQSKLLQVLEDASFERVGESISLTVDVRVIAATNVMIGQALSEKKVRSDLFYRLSPCTIELPPLRERPEDIAPLISIFSAQTATSLGLKRTSFSSALSRPLLHYDWPGNVRELRNVINRLVVHQNIYGQLTTADVETILEESRRLLCHKEETPAPLPAAAPHAGVRMSGGTKTLAEVERNHIMQALALTGGVVSGPGGAAALLGLPRSTLQNRMRKLDIA
jgi:transcriptional regulator with GAF, ATPase, and Fis domain